MRPWSVVVAAAFFAGWVPAQHGDPSRFERGLVAALTADDVEVRSDALAVFEWVGRSRHVAAIAALVDDEDPELRAAALRALGLVAENDPAAQPRVLPLLQQALRDRAPDVVLAALRALAGLPCADWSAVEGLLEHAWPQVRFEAAATLVQSAAPLHPRDIARVLDDAAQSWQGYRVEALFDRLDQHEHRALLAPFAASDRPSLRFRAAEALARIDGPAGFVPASQRVRERARQQNAAAAAALAQRPWTEATVEALLAAVADARLVLFGEVHESEGPLRDAQQRVLRAMVASAPGRVVVGFEPSVETAQRSVLDLATGLGAEVRSMEPGDFAALCAERRYGERDELCGAEIRSVFAADPDVRMLVLRGESHVTPGGHLCRLLPVPPMVVLSVTFPPLEVLGDAPKLVGRVFRRGDDGAVWVWPAQELLLGKSALVAWLDAR